MEQSSDMQPLLCFLLLIVIRSELSVESCRHESISWTCLVTAVIFKRLYMAHTNAIVSYLDFLGLETATRRKTPDEKSEILDC